MHIQKKIYIIHLVVLVVTFEINGEQMKILSGLFLVLFFLGVLILPVQQGEARPKKGKVIRLEALKIEGRIQKPEAFYILQRASLKHKGVDKPESFLPKIIESLETDPF